MPTRKIVRCFCISSTPATIRNLFISPQLAFRISAGKTALINFWTQIEKYKKAKTWRGDLQSKPSIIVSEKTAVSGGCH
ncbi:hypothetical protein L596_021544 [Steinernema carpocapsae]|uniref:Uncharacterized protein n=1 Tax=Steinernema carpocapsae TaxID=34508 RepID=A0A4U5MJW0_STECR|nr:hypothetical protein L596_021544 [Steinernema carpocapsae]